MTTESRKKRPLNQAEHLRMRTIIKTLTLEKAPFRVMQEKLIEVFGENAPAPSTIKHWRKCFAFGEKSVLDKARSGRPIEATTPRMINLVKRLVWANDTMQHRIISGMIGLSASTVLRIIHQHLYMKRRNGRWIPSNVPDEDCLTYKNKMAGKETVIEILTKSGFDVNIDANSELYAFISTECSGTTPPAQMKDDGESSVSDYSSQDHSHKSSDGLVIAEVFTLSHPEEVTRRSVPNVKVPVCPRKARPEIVKARPWIPSAVSPQDDRADPGSLKSINSYKEALNYLGPLEQFALFKENVRVVGLINHIENIFRAEIEMTTVQRTSATIC